MGRAGARRSKQPFLLLFQRRAGAALQGVRGSPAGGIRSIAFSVKANWQSGRCLKTLALLGAGADVVSGGELKKALAAGIPAARIVFSGVGKTRAGDGSGAGGRHLSVQRRKRAGAAGAGTLPFWRSKSRAPVTLAHQSRCRCQNPLPRSPPARRKPNSAFPSPMPATFIARPPPCKGIEIVGVDVHIGSQLTDSGALRNGLRAGSPIWCSNCAPTATIFPGSIWAAGWASPMRTTINRRRILPPMAPSCKRRCRQGFGLPPAVRARPPDRRQCRRALGVAGDRREDRATPTFPDYLGRRNE